MLDRFEISILMDFYGALLTDKQINIMELYYNEDLSLAEIAEINNTSRQAIHDLIKRCYKQLQSYESKLHLLQKNINRRKEISKLIGEMRDKQKLAVEAWDEFEKKMLDL